MFNGSIYLDLQIIDVGTELSIKVPRQRGVDYLKLFRSASGSLKKYMYEGSSFGEMPLHERLPLLLELIHFARAVVIRQILDKSV